jgi:hypothetical protein
MEKYGFVYIWRDRKHNRYYIGSHWGTEDDGYVCSSSWLLKAYKIRPQDFKRKILKRIYSTRADLLNEEFKWISFIKPNEIKVRYYNLNIKSTGHWTAYPENVKNIKQKISLRTKEAMNTQEVRQKYEEGLKTRDCRSSDIEVRAKRSASMKGKNKDRVYTEIALQNIRSAAKKRIGKALTQEHRDKIKSSGVFKQINHKRIACKVCGFEGNPGNIGRYHNDKCKKINL